MPPLPNPPDLLILATELAGVSGTTLPVEVSATDTYMSVTDGKAFRRLSYNSAGRSVTDRTRLSLNAMEMMREALLEGMS